MHLTLPLPLAVLVADEARPAVDRARDADRKPAEVLEFIGIERSMSVFDTSIRGKTDQLVSRLGIPE